MKNLWALLILQFIRSYTYLLNFLSFLVCAPSIDLWCLAAKGMFLSLSFIHSFNTDMLHGSKRVLSKPPGPHAIYDVQAWKPAHAPFKKEVHNDIIHRYFLPGSDIQTPPLTGDTYRTSRWQVLGFHNLRANRLKESTSTPNWAPNWKGCSRSNPRSHYLGCLSKKKSNSGKPRKGWEGDHSIASILWTGDAKWER